MNAITLPELGEGIERATIATWYVKVGDQVKEGDDVVELVTDKATFNVSATTTGRISEVLVKEGADAEIGTILVRIE